MPTDPAGGAATPAGEFHGGVALGINMPAVWVGAAAVLAERLDVWTVAESSVGVPSIGITEQDIPVARLKSWGRSASPFVSYPLSCNCN